MAMLALTPPMGWNAWNYFGPKGINERVVRETADAMVARGYREAGYTFVNVDDCWMSLERDKNGRLQPNPEKFPSGMKALGDYLHERGLRFGLYAGAGVITYAGGAGSFGYEREDARTFAQWGVDLLKYDFGYVAPGTSAPHLFRRMGQALRESGRDILFSGCLGRKAVTEWMKTAGASMWRLSGDIKDSWESIVAVAKNALEMGPIAGHGAWNDPDMMVVGLNGEGYVGQIGGGCTLNEYSAHFSLWCMLSAPLLLGHDLRKEMPEMDRILLNKELIAINQDDLGVQAYALPPMSNGDIVLAKPLYNGDIAFCLLNETDAEKTMILSWDYCGWEMTDRIRLRDVTSHRDLGVFLHGSHFDVPARSAIVLRAHRE